MRNRKETPRRRVKQARQARKRGRETQERTKSSVQQACLKDMIAEEGPVTCRGGCNMPGRLSHARRERPKSVPNSFPRAILGCFGRFLSFIFTNVILLIQSAQFYQLLQYLRVDFAKSHIASEVSQIWAESGILHRR